MSIRHILFHEEYHLFGDCQEDCPENRSGHGVFIRGRSCCGDECLCSFFHNLPLSIVAKAAVKPKRIMNGNLVKMRPVSEETTLPTVEYRVFQRRLYFRCIAAFVVIINKPQACDANHLFHNTMIRLFLVHCREPLSCKYFG